MQLNEAMWIPILFFTLGILVAAYAILKHSMSSSNANLQAVLNLFESAIKSADQKTADVLLLAKTVAEKTPQPVDDVLVAALIELHNQFFNLLIQEHDLGAQIADIEIAEEESNESKGLRG